MFWWRSEDQEADVQAGGLGGDLGSSALGADNFLGQDWVWGQQLPAARCSGRRIPVTLRSDEFLLCFSGVLLPPQSWRSAIPCSRTSVLAFGHLRLGPSG